MRKLASQTPTGQLSYPLAEPARGTLPETKGLNSGLLQNYIFDEELQFNLPNVQFPPISHLGNVAEIIGEFGAAEQLRNAMDQLQTLLYAE